MKQEYSCKILYIKYDLQFLCSEFILYIPFSFCVMLSEVLKYAFSNDIRPVATCISDKLTVLSVSSFNYLDLLTMRKDKQND